MKVEHLKVETALNPNNKHEIMLFIREKGIILVLTEVQVAAMTLLLLKSCEEDKVERN